MTLENLVKCLKFIDLTPILIIESDVANFFEKLTKNKNVKVLNLQDFNELMRKLS